MIADWVLVEDQPMRIKDIGNVLAFLKGGKEGVEICLVLAFESVFVRRRFTPKWLKDLDAEWDALVCNGVLGGFNVDDWGVALEGCQHFAL